MSTADPLRPAHVPGRGGARGFTMIEVAITAVLLAMTTLVIERTISDVRETERTMRAVRTTALEGQEVAYRLRDLVAGSRKLYGNDSAGNAYLALCDRLRFPPLVGSRLPKIDETNPLGPDEAGNPCTGNVLLFVREAAPLPCVAVASTKKMFHVDAHRMVCVYLTRTARSVVAGGSAALDLVEWRGDVYPSYAQVKAMTSSTEQKAVVKDLYSRWAVDYLWDPSQPPTAAFYAIDSLGNIAATPTVPAKLPEDKNFSRGGRFSLANVAIADTDMTSRPRMPVFSADDPAVWTSHGFEVKIVGASGSRKVWIRVTVEQQAAHGRVPAQQTTVVANTRDM